GVACVEERALELVRLALVLRRPVERAGEPGTAVELGWVAPARRPLSGAGGEMSMKVPALAVLVEPVAEAWPLAQQRLVRDLECPLAHDQQTGLGEDADDTRRGLVSFEVELVQRDSAPYDGSGVIQSEPQHDAACHLPLCPVQLAVGALGEARDRGAHPAGGAVRLMAEKSPFVESPELEQHRRHHGPSPRPPPPAP